ncbi:MAG: AAA family ATPase [Patescibacteria group bacterium]
MVYWLTEWMPAPIIMFMARITGKTKLTAIEERVQKEFIASLHLDEGSKTSQQKIVAMVGLLSSGNSSVARALADALSAVVIEGEVIHTQLREAGGSQDRAWKIAENAALAATERGKNVVLDADFIAVEKRKSLLHMAKDVGKDVFFVRVVCHLEMIDYRLLTASYPEGSFFSGANPTCEKLKEIWDTLDGNTRGMLIKKKEMQRRLLNHYQWKGGRHGGKLFLKKMTFVDFEIDTTNEKTWPAEAKHIAKQIRLR